MADSTRDWTLLTVAIGDAPNTATWNLAALVTKEQA
jgi:hypothetical protein